MLIILALALGLTTVVIIFFASPYSPLKKAFSNDCQVLSRQYSSTLGGIITEDDILNLPLPLQKYLQHCGYMGAPKMSAMRASFRHVAFSQSKAGPQLAIDYEQYNFVKEPQRLAFIKSALYGIPFDGYDAYINGVGRMHGVIGKLFTAFNQTGCDMDKASLVTFLSECLLVPSAALQDYILWEPIDTTHAKATITYWGTTAQGIFSFNDDGEAVSFTTEDRAQIAGDGRLNYCQWSAVFGNYQQQGHFLVPTDLKAVWNTPEGDFIYFNSDNIAITYF